jgi:uncharacterized protein
MTEFIWDADKARRNWDKHGVTFEVAALVYEDPMLLVEADPHLDEERWRVIGRVNMTTLFVVHTLVEDDQLIRIISARRATPGERKRYDDGYS